jgi:hypothetical protein
VDALSSACNPSVTITGSTDSAVTIQPFVHL